MYRVDSLCDDLYFVPATVKGCAFATFRLPKYCETCFTSLTGYVNGLGPRGSRRTPKPLFLSFSSSPFLRRPYPLLQLCRIWHKTLRHLNVEFWKAIGQKSSSHCSICTLTVDINVFFSLCLLSLIYNYSIDRFSREKWTHFSGIRILYTR